MDESKQIIIEALQTALPHIKALGYDASGIESLLDGLLSGENPLLDVSDMDLGEVYIEESGSRTKKFVPPTPNDMALFKGGGLKFPFVK